MQPGRQIPTFLQIRAACVSSKIICRGINAFPHEKLAILRVVVVLCFTFPATVAELVIRCRDRGQVWLDDIEVEPIDSLASGKRYKAIARKIKEVLQP